MMQQSESKAGGSNVGNIVWDVCAVQSWKILDSKKFLKDKRKISEFTLLVKKYPGK
jgi:hypothetical protein